MHRHYIKMHGHLEKSEPAQLQHFSKSKLPDLEPEEFYCRSALINIVSDSDVIDRKPMKKSFSKYEVKILAIKMLEDLLDTTNDADARRTLSKTISSRKRRLALSEMD